MLNADPNLHACAALKGLGGVETKHGAFDDAEPLDVDAQAKAECLGDIANTAAVQVDLAHIVKRGEIDVADAGEVIEVVVPAIAQDGDAPFEAAEPGQAALALGDVEAAEMVAAAQ